MKSKMFLLLLAMFVLATPMFAQEAAVAHSRGDCITTGSCNGDRLGSLRACSGPGACVVGRSDRT